ncbi:MAG: hypothetical protein A2498_08605 [Lentisphaerae bacterium RIFOXYC12_FULL_60_16]|nr:MAG: hypothetical protein A2498_08605 [Lentisphaerae bacterium RIFOXYC12_FULL_60_16]
MTAPAVKRPWYVYILACSDTTFYVGITPDLVEREKKHNTGKASYYTRVRLPVKMVYAEAQPDHSSARKREMELKRWRRDRKAALVASACNLLRA